MLTHHKLLTVLYLSLVYAAISFQQTSVFGVCLDIGQQYAGAMVGLMNTASQVGGFLGTLAFGYIVHLTGSYNAPFIPMVALLLLGSALWFKVDASIPLTQLPSPNLPPPAPS